MNEAVAQREQLPPHVHELATPDGAVVVQASPFGGQIWAAEVNGHQIIFPLTQAHSIAKDPRLGGNNERLGETFLPGGSFVSIGGGEVVDENGVVVNEASVHGPFGAPWYLYRMIINTDGRRMALSGGPDSRTDGFFQDDERWSAERTFEAVQGADASQNELRISTTLTNSSPRAWVPPKMVEHTYLVGGGDLATLDNTAIILNAHGQPVRPEYIERTTAPNGNDMDTTLPTTQIGTQGMCAFMPNGISGHVVLMTASTEYPDGRSAPVQAFDIYRKDYSDGWTGVEPVMVAESVEPGSSITLKVSIRTFESLEEYKAALPALLVESR